MIVISCLNIAIFIRENNPDAVNSSTAIFNAYVEQINYDLNNNYLDNIEKAEIYNIYVYFSLQL